MGGEWIKRRLGDLLDVKHGFAFDGRFFKDEDEGPVLVTPGNFKIGGGFSSANVRYFVGQVPPSFELAPGDVIVTMTDLSKAGDTLGYAAVVPDDGRRYLHNQRIGKVVLKPGAPTSIAYIHWLMRTARYRAEVLGSATGSTVRHTSPSRIAAFEFELPSREEQVAIADLLCALDDKIELNRRMAETQEAMARTLFKSWFVEFAPVRAKAEGRPSGLADELAALFPDSFGEDGLPMGWSTRTFSDLFAISGGNTPRTENATYWGGPHQWATPKDLSGLATPVLLQTARQLTDEGLTQTSSGLLPAYSLLLSTRAPIGYMAFVDRPTAINQGLAGIARKKTSPAYAWAWCHTNIDVITGNAGGSTFPEISKAVLRRLSMLAPSQPVLDAFGSIVDSIIDRIIVSAKEAQTLADLRDTLLPKLISGKVRIADAGARITAA